MATAHHPARTGAVIALLLGSFLGFAGIAHFVNPQFFDDIVPPWLPPSERFWTYLSGVAELIIATMLLVPRWRRLGGLAAVALFIAVYPANLYMAWDWRHRPFSEQVVSYGRLPFQFLFVWLAWYVAKQARSVRLAAAHPPDAQGRV